MFSRLRARIHTIVSDVEIFVIVVAAILFIIFLLQNTRSIQVNFLFIETHLPTVILILVTTLAGFFVGLVTAYILHRRHNKAEQREAAASRAPQPPA